MCILACLLKEKDHALSTLVAAVVVATISRNLKLLHLFRVFSKLQRIKHAARIHALRSFLTLIVSSINFCSGLENSVEEAFTIATIDGLSLNCPT